MTLDRLVKQRKSIAFAGSLFLSSYFGAGCTILPLQPEQSKTDERDTVIFDINVPGDSMCWSQKYKTLLLARDKKGIKDFAFIRKVRQYSETVRNITDIEDSILNWHFENKTFHSEEMDLGAPIDIISFRLEVTNSDNEKIVIERPFKLYNNLYFPQCNPFSSECGVSNWESLDTLKRIDLVKKVLDIDTTNKHEYIPGEYECSNFSADLTKSCRSCEKNIDGLVFDIPIYRVFLGNHINHADDHSINGILVGDNPTDIRDWRFIEPQSDHIFSNDYLGYDHNSYSGTVEGYRTIIVSGDFSKINPYYSAPVVIFSLVSTEPSKAVYTNPFFIIQKPQTQTSSILKTKGG